jgi:hypothetical protein
VEYTLAAMKPPKVAIQLLPVPVGPQISKFCRRASPATCRRW